MGDPKMGAGDGSTALASRGEGGRMRSHDLDVAACRRQFPALARTLDGREVVFLDGPAGSQVPRRVADAVSDYLLNHNANSHGLFATSRETDSMLEAAHRAMADLIGAPHPEEIVFGANMTTLTFALSRALSRTWTTEDEVVVTALDHDANVSPWVLGARDAGAQVRVVRFHPEDCTLDLEDLRAKLSRRTRLLAVGCASNATGTVNPIRRIVELAHDVGAEVFVDAVHSTPHALPDVAGWDCDYLACSAYKFFGPHVGVMWGRAARLAEIDAYRVRPAGEALPGKWMTGTQNHEGIAGALAAVNYLEELAGGPAIDPTPRRDRLVEAFASIGRHERALSLRLLRGLAELPSVRVWGIRDIERLDERVPTVSMTHARRRPHEVAAELGRLGIFVWHGNYYALSLTEALGLEPDGMVRIGPLHYNTVEEIDRFLATLAEMEE